MMDIAAIICCLLASIPSILLMLNLVRYRRAPRLWKGLARPPKVAVLIPARNEEGNIAACLESVLQNRDVELEVIVVDDHSTDRTRETVQGIAARDGRVRCVSSQPLPKDWCGKQFACHQASEQATAPYSIFIDADVRVTSDALVRTIAFLEASGADLVSGVPRQITVSFSEKLLIPLIHFILLAYLPMGLMRRFRSPAFAAGCGQLIATRAESYRKAGGHQAVASSGHDGITLPRAFRKRGFKTDLFDPTDIARCRMYPSGSAVWSGLAKNAIEGIARPALIVPFTLLFLGGHILPLFLLLACALLGAPVTTFIWLAAGITLSFAARFACSWRFNQSWLGALLHPLALLMFLGIQWWAFYQGKRGRSFFWKGRPQPHFAR